VAHGGRLITDTHPHGMLTFEQGMAVSSNIVLAKVSDRIGNELLYTTARSFGFGTETGIELPGEIAGELKKPSQWSGVTLNSMAIGYEVGVTPLQIAAAYGAVANGGVLMRPFIVKRVFDEQGALLEETRPQQIRRVLSPATARVLTRFFEGVVNASDGTGKEARVPGLRIAGKTGTSRKFVDGRYEPGKYTASFVGFFPADAPQVVCLVMLDITGGNAYTGGLVSAPIFREVARKVHAMAGRYNGTRAPVPGVRGSLPVPDVATLRVEAARRLLAAQGFAVRVRGTGTVVRAQEPLPGRTLPRGGDVVLSTGGAPAEGVAPGYTVVPDLRGMPMRRAINALVAQHLDAAVSGSGVVAAQAPPGGGQVRTGTRVLVRCEPRKTALFTEN
jgi:cell division protein FtsI (penicillin-binding protein 3)